MVFAMRILCLHNRYLYPGGEDAVFEAETALLRQKGHEVIVYEDTNQSIEHLPPLSKALFLAGDFFFNRSHYRRLKALIQERRPHIAHVHNTFYVLSPSIYQTCFEARVPVVQTLHNYRLLCPAATFFRDGQVCTECLTHGRGRAIVHRCFKGSLAAGLMLNRLIDGYYRRGIVQRVARFIAPSRFSRSMFVRAGWPEDKIIVKPHFLQFDRAPAAPKQNYMLYAGGLHDYKGVDVLIEAWAVAAPSGFQLKIVGDGPMAGSLKEKVRQRSLNVEFLGHRSGPEVLDLMTHAYALIAPSLCFESFARVIMEAFACSTPVIASGHGAMKELVEEGSTGYLFEPGKAGSLSAKILAMVANPAQAGAMAGRARQTYEAHFTAKANYQQLMAIYEGVLKQQ